MICLTKSETFNGMDYSEKHKGQGTKAVGVVNAKECHAHLVAGYDSLIHVVWYQVVLARGKGRDTEREQAC